MNDLGSAAYDEDGNAIRPMEGIFPILVEYRPKRLLLMGTGFWITRYGLFLTAGHVVDEIIDGPNGKPRTATALHFRSDEGVIHARSIRRITRLHGADLAVGQAENFMDKVPAAPLSNRVAVLSTTIPPIGSRLVTFGYPENRTPFDVSGPEKGVFRIACRYFEGQLRTAATRSTHPLLPYPHLETSIELPGGVSGGPVIDEKGRVVAVNCRAWSFLEQGENLSYVVPLGELMQAEIPLLQLPPNSWEAAQVPAARRGKPLTIAELAAYGHIRFEL